MAELVWSCSCCVRLKSSPEETEQRSRSRQIDKLLEKDKHQYKRQVKILLLGAGESGKSTFIKQMKIIHGMHFDDELLREYRTIIYQNVVLGMKVLVDARNKLGIAWDTTHQPLNYHHRQSQEKGQELDLDQEAAAAVDEENKKAVERLRENAEKILRFDNQKTKDLWDTQLFLDYVPIVKELWQDSGIRKAFDRRREFQLPDSVKYFLDNINRIGSMRYIPSNQDILHARRATKGISELTILIRGIPFLFVDVGGQRSQRQKWFQCFDSITSILFLVSSSEFDQVIIEDRCTNRLIESMNIFETIVNNRCFGEVSVILFLNKTDLLEQKLNRKDTDISKHFPNFSGNSHNLNNVQEFIKSMFDDVRRDRRRPLFCHFTTAVDTENIKLVFNAVRDTILSNNLKQLMLQ